MMTFIETPRFPEDISYGSKGGPRFMTTIAQVQSGYETRNVNWQYPLHEYDAIYGIKDDADMYQVIEFHMAMRGRAYGFRYKDWNDFTSISGSQQQGTRSPTDQKSGDGDGVTVKFQLKKLYQKGALSLTRIIAKPVSATVSCAIGGVESNNKWSVNYATGSVTFDPENVKYISDITNASAAVFTFTSAVGGKYNIGDTFYISGVSGMEAINGNRVTVLNTTTFTITVDHDTTSYSAYTSGGNIKHLPQTGEEVTFGYEFDVPCRFDSDFLDITQDAYTIESANIKIVEIRL